MDEDAADAVARLATWYHRLSTGVRLAWMFVMAIAIYVALTQSGFLPAAGLLAVYLAGVVPTLKLRTESVLRTDEDPAAVREQFETLANPATFAWTALADGESRDDAGPDGGTVGAGDLPDDEELLSVLTRSSLFRLSQYTVTLTRTPAEDGGVRFLARMEGAVVTTIHVAVAAEGDGTRVETSMRREKLPPRSLVNLKLAEPIEHRVLSHLGYRPVESRVYVGLRGR